MSSSFLVLEAREIFSVTYLFEDLFLSSLFKRAVVRAFEDYSLLLLLLPRRRSRRFPRSADNRLVSILGRRIHFSLQDTEKTHPNRLTLLFRAPTERAAAIEN